jgi:hypothetical protein
VLAGKTRRALDSVVLDDAVATQNTITQLIAAIRRVGREVPGAAEVIATRCHAHDYTDLGKPAIARDDTAAREALVSASVIDALVVVEEFARATLSGKPAEALALVAGQAVELAEGSDGTAGRWRIAPESRCGPGDLRGRSPGAARAQTVSHKQDDYKGHVVVEPDAGLFTGGRLAPASGVAHYEAVIGCVLIRRRA